MSGPQRHLVLWVPDWPVRAAFGAEAATEPVAIVQANVVVACSGAARQRGVRRGDRRRAAQMKAPDLRMLPADPMRDERLFLPLLRILEERVPGIHPLRPGLVALRARGAARYYGGEREAAMHLIEVLAENGHPSARAGVADGLFTAEQAARLADPMLVVPPGEARPFLAPLPVEALSEPDAAAFFEKLGVRTLGDLAALDARAVFDRLGQRGARLHALAGGADSRAGEPQPPEPDLARRVDFDAPLTQADQIAFAVRQTADAVIAALAERSQVCTEVRIDMTDDDGSLDSREWLHPTSFDSGDLVDRVRWQLEALAPSASTEVRVGAGICEVRITPTRIDDSANHQPGLFGQGPEQRLHHVVSRVQALLGHRAVVTPVIAGGRRLAERQVLQPWGDRLPRERDAAQPWPGSMPHPLPSEIFIPPVPIRVTAADDSPPVVDDRGELSAAPARIEGAAIMLWAGPWPLRERSWDAPRSRSAQRLQIVDEHQRAWLVLWEDDSWWAEGRYR
ncbi:DNA polymerase Y family protein [Microbacterium sp. GXF6406]